MNIKEISLKSGKKSYKADLWKFGRFIRSKTFKKRVFAEKWLVEESSKDYSEQSQLKEVSKITLKDFFEQDFLKISNIRPSTMKTYSASLRLHVFPYLGEMKLSKIDKGSIRLWLETMSKKKISKATINRNRTAFSPVLKAACEEQLISSNPFQGVRWAKESPKEIGYWSKEELTKLLQESYSHQQMFILFLMAYETGMRISELLGLQWECINLASCTITVKMVWCDKEKKLRDSTKSNRIRTLPLSPSLGEHLLKFSSKRKGFVFSRNGKPLQYSFVRKRLSKLISKVQVKNLGFHSFRHTYASHFLMAGGDLKDLKDLLGHQDYATTLRYSHMDVARLHEKARRVQFEMPKQDNLETNQAFLKLLP